MKIILKLITTLAFVLSSVSNFAFASSTNDESQLNGLMLEFLARQQVEYKQATEDISKFRKELSAAQKKKDEYHLLTEFGVSAGFSTIPLTFGAVMVSAVVNPNSTTALGTIIKIGGVAIGTCILVSLGSHYMMKLTEVEMENIRLNLDIAERKKDEAYNIISEKMKTLSEEEQIIVMKRSDETPRTPSITLTIQKSND